MYTINNNISRVKIYQLIYLSDDMTRITSQVSEKNKKAAELDTMLLEERNGRFAIHRAQRHVIILERRIAEIETRKLSYGRESRLKKARDESRDARERACGPSRHCSAFRNLIYNSLRLCRLCYAGEREAKRASLRNDRDFGERARHVRLNGAIATAKV